jgi:hypothetical protein
VLPSLGVENLTEITLPVEEADADEGQLQVARGLEDVAGENAETSGVYRKDFGQPELRRKVGDAVVPHRQLPHARVKRLRRVLERELGGDAVEHGQKGRVGRRRLETLGRNAAQERRRVAAHRRPELRVERRKKSPDRGAPRPPEVPGEPEKNGQVRRKVEARVALRQLFHRLDRE